MLPSNVNIKTSCEHCIFAKYDGLVQIGCEFNRIEKFQKTAEVKLVDNTKKQYYEIEKRICNYCTLPDALDGGKTIAEVKNETIEELKVKFALIVKEDTDTALDVKYYIKHKLPVEIHILSWTNNFKKDYSFPNVYYHWLKEDLKEDALIRMIGNKAKDAMYLIRSYGSARKTVTRKVLDDVEERVNGNLERFMYHTGRHHYIAHRRGLLHFDGKIRKFKSALNNATA
jgi:hypothetical protein